MCNVLVFEDETVSERISARLEFLERSKSWLARRLGVNDMWVIRRLSGGTRFHLADVPRFADALGVSACWLLGDDSSREVQAEADR